MIWFEDFPALWEIELGALLAWFPQSTYQFAGQEVIFDIPVIVQQKPLSSVKEHVLKLVVSAKYPAKAPKIFVKTLTFPLQNKYGQRRPKHLYFDDSLCLFYPGDPPQKRWLPEDGLVTLVAWAVEWLEAYYYWRFRNEWPGEDAHRDAKRSRK